MEKIIITKEVKIFKPDKGMTIKEYGG